VLALVVRLAFTLVSDRWQAPSARDSKPTSKREVRRIGVENFDVSCAVRPVQAEIFIGFSERIRAGAR